MVSHEHALLHRLYPRGGVRNVAVVEICQDRVVIA